MNSYLENQHKTGENRLPQRSMLLPAGVRGITHQNAEQSDRVQLLSGHWKFCYCTQETGNQFAMPEFDDSKWDTVPVPSMWQYLGYGKCKYPNVQYPFPFDPPYIHCENPVGLYRVIFDGKRTNTSILRFLGVGGAFFVWLNGEYVGFSKGSRLAAEFDISQILREGENLLAVKVHTWSDASYLENQDMLLANGIFRDVSLVQCGESYLWDYTLVPDECGFRLFPETRGSEMLSAVLYDREGDVVCEIADCGEESFLPVENPHFWNAEDPYLYELVLTVGDEVHTKQVGLCFSEVCGNQLTMNGQPITLKGVNRHDNNCYTGQAITHSQIRKELEDIKACNLNAVRCCHYTQHPVFYEIASELGLYVMDEADLETHGCFESGNQGLLTQNPDWYDPYFDRISRMYWQNKNETCINIWSLGNECGDGLLLDQMARWLREQRVKKPLRFHTDGYLQGEQRDFRTTGYMPMSTLESFSPEGKPVLMVEYAHAMGNSPGGLEDIWQFVYTHDYLCGGYVWEYKSHGFYTMGKEGRPRYLYGGDFDDIYHWSNFSLDGFHTSDGTPKPTWAELKEVSAPVYAERKSWGIEVYNTYDFTPLKGVVAVGTIAGLKKGERTAQVFRTETIDLPTVAPRQSVSLPFSWDISGVEGHVTARFQFYQGDCCLGDKEFVLQDQPILIPPVASSPYRVRKAGDEIIVSGDAFHAVWSKGLLCRLEKEGRVLMNRPMVLHAWRAYTDNDGVYGHAPRCMGDWKTDLVHTAKFGFHNMTVEQTGDRVVMKVTGKLLPQGRYWWFDITMIYTVCGGEIALSVNGVPQGNLPKNLPRLGIRLDLPEAYQQCSWYGRGPGDSYADRKANAHFGNWQNDISQLNFLYDVPQETGNHEDCRLLCISGGDLSLTVMGNFSFSCHDFTLENLTAARHFDELERIERKQLYVDYKMRPIGSASCGPEPEEKYELRPHAFTWEIVFC